MCWPWQGGRSHLFLHHKDTASFDIHVLSLAFLVGKEEAELVKQTWIFVVRKRIHPVPLLMDTLHHAHQRASRIGNRRRHITVLYPQTQSRTFPASHTRGRAGRTMAPCSPEWVFRGCGQLTGRFRCRGWAGWSASPGLGTLGGWLSLTGLWQSRYSTLSDIGCGDVWLGLVCTYLESIIRESIVRRWLRPHFLHGFSGLRLTDGGIRELFEPKTGPKQVRCLEVPLILHLSGPTPKAVQELSIRCGQGVFGTLENA